ncbi:hypothetical protein [Chryseobacterium sp.]|uniref:hypothetical protein n=1 Tax=Chryseobacterium sp. TaxID=1871047 RepID=UPI00388EBBA2
MDRLENKIIELLNKNEFQKINNHFQIFDCESQIYAKEIKKNIFLLFIIKVAEHVEKAKAIIAQFDSPENIGVKDPVQILFHLSIKEKKDLMYLDQYLKVSQL